MSGALSFDPWVVIQNQHQRPTAPNVPNTPNPSSTSPAGLGDLGTLGATPHAVEKSPPSNLCEDIASDIALSTTERIAIIAESEEGSAVKRVSHKLPPSWRDPTVIPSAGGQCGKCTGNVWWMDANKLSGWLCAVCYPAENSGVGHFRVVIT